MAPNPIPTIIRLLFPRRAVRRHQRNNSPLRTIATALVLALLGSATLVIPWPPTTPTTWPEPLTEHPNPSQVIVEDSTQHILPLPSGPIPSDALSASVISVYDGDSLRIRFLDGHGIPISQPQRRVNPSRITAEDALKVKNEQLSIRLCSIDAPEVSQDYGTLARDLLRGEVQGTEVWVQIMDRDQYGRLVANVYLRDGTQLNRLMVSQGLAWHYEQFSRDSELARLQQEAQRAGRGLWASPRPLPPWEYRKTRRYQN